MGLTYRGTDIQTSNIKLFVVRGYAEYPEVRGEDGIILGKAGRFERNRLDDRRIVELRGHVEGTGATETAKQQSWRSSTDTLFALLDPTLSPGALVASPPELGLPSGTKTIQVRTLNAIGGPITAWRYQAWTIELECIADPPDWS